MKVACLILASAALVCAEEFTVGNKKVAGEVKRVDPDSLVVETEDGIVRVQLATLTPELQKRYGYNPAKAAQHAAAVAQSAALKAQQDRVALQKESIAKDVAELVETVKRQGQEYNISVIQVLDDGLLVRMPGGSNAHVSADSKGLVDGARLSEILYPAGTRQYTTALGARATVRAFALTPQAAARLLIQQQAK